jgi:nucleotide-binding universal stress UspA family protein
MNDVNRVLVVCEITSNCGEIAHHAALLARAMRAQLFLLTVIYNPFGVMGLSFPRPSLQEDYRKLLENIRSELRNIAGLESLQGIAVQELIREGKPLNEIVTVVREKKIDLLVLPAQAQTWLEHALSGGTNKVLLRKMPCSILYVKSEPKAIAEQEEEGEALQAA